jgi:hypothetical protein
MEMKIDGKISTHPSASTFQFWGLMNLVWTGEMAKAPLPKPAVISPLTRPTWWGYHWGREENLYKMVSKVKLNACHQIAPYGNYCRISAISIQ